MAVPVFRESSLLCKGRSRGGSRPLNKSHLTPFRTSSIIIEWRPKLQFRGHMIHATPHTFHISAWLRALVLPKSERSLRFELKRHVNACTPRW